MKKIAAFGLPFANIAILLWIEQGLQISYGWKTAAKIILFLLIPFFLFRPTRLPFLQFRKIDRKSILISSGAGIGMLAIIIGTFNLLQPYIDLESLRLDLEDSGVNSLIFPIIAFYILLGNSFIEEFFFRGILPDLLRQSRSRLFLPSFFFAIYHIAIFLPWFTPPLLALAIGGLWAGGIIFQLLNEKSGVILPSWIVHMWADAGILLIGAYLFYFK
ncbi:CPBP family intramembrane glutamic endopeptidase [Sporosarcina sp. FSL W7-1349]|uniref:CPBP family intramembrane glutamic endopeptidase n=1 Tax=Sporosarcina sp. FSL W7-1349 TaxID=2921561 RepID=UPI0030F6B2F7